MKQPYRHFDLPTTHLSMESAHHVPRRATQPSEVDRRRSLAKGTLVAEEQARGIGVASSMLWQLFEPEDIAFARRIVSAAGINTAWYDFAAGSDVMRRRLLLPQLDGDRLDVDPEALFNHATDELQNAVPLASRLIDAIGRRTKTREAYQMQLGRRVGNASLTLACLPVAELLAERPYTDAITTQDYVRRTAMRTLEDARTLVNTVGVHPSFAGFAHPDNQLAYYIRTNAPAGVVEALESAQS